MKVLRRSMPVVVILAAIFLSSCQTAPPAREEIDSLEAKLADRETELIKAGGTIADLETEVADLRAKLASLENELGALSKGAANLTQTREELTRDRDALRARAGELEALIQDLNARLAAAAASIDDLKEREAGLTRSRDTLAAAAVAKQDALQASIVALTKEKDDLVRRVAELSAANDSLNAALTEQGRKLAEAVEQLRRQLKVEVERGDIDILLYRDVIIVNIKDAIGFQPDSAVLRPEFGPILRKIAEVFAKFPDKVIRVEGHTAVAPSRWTNSWDLGAARAVNVVRYLQEKAGVEPTRLVALSFGEYRPLAPNATEEERRKNRRVEIVLVERPLYQVNELVNSTK